LVDSDIIAGRLGFMVFGNKSGSLSSSRYGLPEAVDRAVARETRPKLGSRAVFLSKTESQRIVNDLENMQVPIDFMGQVTQKRFSAIATQAARRNNVDSLLIVLPAGIFFHENLPTGKGFYIFSANDKAYAHTSLNYWIVHAKTGEIIAKQSQHAAEEIPNSEEWDRLVNESNPEIGPIFLKLIDKNTREAFQQMGL